MAPTAVAAIRAAVRERDGYCCTMCGMTNAEHQHACGKQLHVHRLVPRSLYTVDGCITVCQRCHGGLPRAAPGTPDPYRNGENINVWVDAALADALDRFMASLELRPSLTAVTELAYRELLKSRGFWPPAEDQKEQP